MALKGQVWPGMGKMDLANEEMKRTRNQRKPKSVIEKMRRASEGIEPNQVVMTTDFEVEKVKGVYDSSSPEPEQQESVRALFLAIYPRLQKHRLLSGNPSQNARGQHL